MKRARVFVATVGFALLVSGPPSPAAAADTEGFFLGFDLHASHVGGDDGRDAPSGSRLNVKEVGGGASLVLGYGLTPSFALRLDLTGATHETSNPDADVRLSSGTIEGAYLFRAGQPLRPYLFGGLGGFRIESSQGAVEYDTKGPGAVAGAGLVYFLGEHFALDFAVRGDFINWERSTATLTNEQGTAVSVETSIEEEGTAGNVLFGVGWWF